MLARTCRRRRAAPTATTWSTTPRINEELGGAAGHAASLARAARRTASARCSTSCRTTWPSPAGRTAWWWDVLENGPASRYAALLRHRLGPAARPVCAHGARPRAGRPLRPRPRSGRAAARPRRRRVHACATSTTSCPLSPRTLDGVLGAAAAAPSAPTSSASIAEAFGHLPHATDTDAASMAERHRDKELLASATGERSWRQDAAVAAAIDAELAADQRRPRRRSTRCCGGRTTAWPLADGERGARLPPLLQHRHPGRACASRTRPCSRPTHALVARAGRDGAPSTGCASTTSTACAIRRSTSNGCATARRRARRRGEDPRRRTRRCRTLAGGGHDRLRLPERVDGLFVDGDARRR